MRAETNGPRSDSTRSCTRSDISPEIIHQQDRMPAWWFDLNERERRAINRIAKFMLHMRTEKMESGKYIINFNAQGISVNADVGYHERF